MKIENKLAINSLKKYKKRYLYITISIILGSFLLFTTMLLISSIKSGMTEAINKEYDDYNGYHVEMNNVQLGYINIIKEKEYVDTIYIQIDDEEKIKEIESIDSSKLESANFIKIYIKFKNAKDTCTNVDDIIETLNLSNSYLADNVWFNQQILNLNGLMDVYLANGPNNTAICIARVNMNYVINFFIVLVAIIFLVIFLIILYSNFYVTMNERKKEYAVLNSIGATENQLLKIATFEGTLIGVIGIIIGIILSFIGANIILSLLNNILKSTIYSFRLIPKISYFVIFIVLVFYNIYLAIILSLTKINGISAIKNNKKLKKIGKTSIFQKLFSVEGKLALKNLKRNKSKYIVLTILLTVCMTGYVCVSTYIEYETKISDTVLEYDFDAQFEIKFEDDIDYKSILKEYEKESGSNVEYIEYKGEEWVTGLIEPQEGINTSVLETKLNDFTYKVDDKIFMYMTIIGLEDDVYNDYIKEVHGNYGDIIFYNTYSTYNYSANKREYRNVFDEKYNIDDIQFVDISGTTGNEEINNLDNQTFKGKFILVDDYFDFFKDTGSKPVVFVNMEMFDKFQKNYNEAWNNISPDSYQIDSYFVRIRCDDVVDFSTYIKNVQDEQGINLSAGFYTLDQQETIIYLKIVQLALRIVLVALVLIGVVSGINIINASLQERIDEFKILNRIGATNKNINKVLIYESLFVFVKSAIISIILSIPIIYLIIKYINNLYGINELLVPFGKIAIFYLLLLVISITVTLLSGKFVKNK